MDLALFGDPVSHSKSPAMHRAALAHHGMEGDYHARRVPAGDFSDAISDIRRGALHGVNVTMPHKRRAYEAADVVSPEAALGQSVNSLQLVGTRLHGITTDVTAIRSLWSRAGLGAGRVIVLGSGGAAAAALVALAPMVDHLAVSARRPEAIVELTAQLAFSVDVHPWGQELEGVAVNATPLGMKGEELPDWTAEASGLFDMAYGPEVTPGVSRFTGRGRPVVDGLDMLCEQAAQAFEWWTGLEAPRQEMRAAASA